MFPDQFPCLYRAQGYQLYYSGRIETGKSSRHDTDVTNGIFDDLLFFDIP